MGAKAINVDILRVYSVVCSRCGTVLTGLGHHEAHLVADEHIRSRHPTASVKVHDRVSG